MALDTVRDDYESPASAGFDTFEDGEYTVKGVICDTVDDNGQPMLVENSGRLSARFRYVLANGDSGPPHNLALGNIHLWAKHFNLPIKRGPEVRPFNQGEVSAYITAVTNAINQASVDHPFNVAVYRGWVNDFPDMELGEGEFYGQLLAVYPQRDGKPYPKQGAYGLYFRTKWTCVAGPGGVFSPIVDAEWTEFVPYAIEVRNNEPFFEKTKDGKNLTSESERLAKLLKYTAPALFPEGGKFKPPDANNILPYWASVALAAPQVIKIFRVMGKHKIAARSFLPCDVEIAGVTDGSGPVVEPAPWDQPEAQPNGDTSTRVVVINRVPHVNPAAEAETSRQCVLILAEAMAALAGQAGAKVVEADLSLTAVGKEMAGRYLAPLLKENKLPGVKVSEYNYDNVAEFFAKYLPGNESVIGELYAKFTAAGLGIALKQEAPAVATAEAENPFA